MARILYANSMPVKKGATAQRHKGATALIIRLGEVCNFAAK